MRFLKVNIAVGGHWVEEIEIPVLDDDATLDELDEFALEAFNEAVSMNWEVVDA